ncbi:hypothetical protein H6P81_015485 [Aristolochia fimbriata]|uniref:isoleucine--tRNA ligase n=1 Tax=Aristolochia fimbriata TaxID=158543 RepID=A0AAV7E7S5_ARIFI|nr:hypothetical protein H6P81_015485 [Aristolochia fimbriata]
MDEVCEGKDFSFPGQEEKILEFWEDIQAFEKQLKLTEHLPEYIFYDGPPFATGLPHYGHILAGTIKDIVTRYQTMIGHHVMRRFGWDCHGLPVEFEIDTKLGIKTRDEVLKMGIDKYNEECRSIETRYVAEWEKVVSRTGRWIDFSNDYKTMDFKFMESVWWVFKTLYEKNLVYRGFKVMPYTLVVKPLFQTLRQEVPDPAIMVSFPLIGDPHNAALVAWTTTPWTLPSNLALCVRASFAYVKLPVKKTKGAAVNGPPQDSKNSNPKSKGSSNDKTEGGIDSRAFELLEEFPGSSLVGKKYVPLFDFFKELSDAAFRVVSDDYVTEDSGTGVVHSAPAFGEDDNRVCLNWEIIKKGEPLIVAVNDDGRITAKISDFKGCHVKEADDDIIEAVKAKGRLVNKGSITHTYPFCWRSETPLLYRAVPSWFVSVEKIKKELLESNEQTYWVPDYIKDLLAEVDFGAHLFPYGLVKMARKQELSDLWRNSKHFLVSRLLICIDTRLIILPFLLHVVLNSVCCDVLRMCSIVGLRVDLCRLDQTRGWFYALMVLSTALFGKPAFRNLICNGLVLAEDGKKMSKRLKNYPSPMEVIGDYGADALRLYLINSPVVRAEPLRFKKDGVYSVVKDVFLPWYNAYRFLFKIQRDLRLKWIYSATESLVHFVRQEMDAYRLYTVVPYLLKFMDNLTNIFVRFNRKRLKGRTGEDDCRIA